MTSRPHTLLDRTFRDENGQIVLGQVPNIPIIGWLLFKVLSLVTDNRLSDAFAQISTAFLFTWAYLEITQGANYFRRFLGVFVIAVILWGFAM